MDETRRERRLRFSLIFIILAFIVFAFFARSNKIDTDSERVQTAPFVAVIQKSEKQTDNPFVAVSEYIDEKPILALYEIERNNDFFFKTTTAVELKMPPEELAPDSEGRGVWVKISGEWYFLNELLEEEEKNEQYRDVVEKVDFLMTENETETTVTIANNDFSLKPNEKIISIFRLSTDDHIWLAVTESGLTILY